jgi:hypothetical protein
MKMMLLILMVTFTSSCVSVRYFHNGEDITEDVVERCKKNPHRQGCDLVDKRH